MVIKSVMVIKIIPLFRNVNIKTLVFQYSINVENWTFTGSKIITEKCRLEKSGIFLDTNGYHFQMTKCTFEPNNLPMVPK